MSDLTTQLRQSIMLEQQRTQVRCALRRLELAATDVESYFVGGMTTHRHALRSLAKACGHGGLLEREIMGLIVLAGYRGDLADCDGEGGAA